MIKVLLYLLHICLITHKNELNRKETNTGQIVLSESNKHQYDTSIIPWGGRDDNDAIDQVIKSFTRTPTLLWTSSNNNTNSSPIIEKNDDPIYIVLDGTWQEAEKIYRSGPLSLRHLPKLFIASSSPTRYNLRKNYGYKNKYDTTNNNNLLCTAEICAEILLKEEGIDSIAARDIIIALDNFQKRL